MAKMRFNVFTKTKKTAEGKDFKVRLTKNDNGLTYEVRFTQDCENVKLLPKDNTPFVLVADTKHLSLASKRVHSTKDDKYFTKHIIYVREITDIEDYEEPEFDADTFNNAKPVEDGGDDIPF